MTKKFTPKQYAEALRRLAKSAQGSGLAKAALAGGSVIDGHAKVNVMNTFKKVTGDLAASIQTLLVSSTPTRAVVEVGPTVIYGRIQELGGTINPRNAKKLHWVDEEGNHHSAFSVTLPARPYMKPAAEDHVPDIIGAVAENLRITIEGDL